MLQAYGYSLDIANLLGLTRAGRMVTWSGTVIFHDNDPMPYQDLAGDSLKVENCGRWECLRGCKLAVNWFLQGVREPSRGVISRGAIFTGTNLLSPPAHCSFMFLEIGKDATLNHPQL